MKNLRLLALLSQLAVSIITPLLFFILGARWLTIRFGLGKWVMAAGVLLGIAGAVSGLVSTLKLLQREAERETKNTPVCFNDHE